MDTTLIDAAAGALRIGGVYLKDSHVHCKEGFLPQFVDDGLSLVPQYRGGATGEIRVISAKQEDGDAAKIVLFYFFAGVRLVEGASLEAAEAQQDVPDEAVYVEITTEFYAQYDCDAGVDDKALRPAFEEFGRYNVGYQIWPYWREYVQNICARLGLPPIPVPMYRIPQREPGSENSSE